jgi:hypothetical protein
VPNTIVPIGPVTVSNHRAAREATVPHKAIRSALACMVALSLVCQPIVPVLAQAPLTREDYNACQVKDDAQFRQALEALTLKVLQASLAKVDYQALVGDAWRREQFGEFIDKRVDIGIEELKNQTSWIERWSSLASSEKSKELANRTAELVYRSDAMKAQLEQLAVSAGREIGRTMELATIDASSQTVSCLQAFLGPRFGTTVAGVVGDSAERAYRVDQGTAPISPGSVILEGKEGITGVVVLMLRRQLANMASRVGQRLVGSVLSRLVSVVAGGVGVVLIAKDIWDFRHGVLPIIATEMKSPATKAKVQEELARSINEQIAEHTREIASGTADRVLQIWQEFRRGHAKVVELAEHNDGFRRFLDALKPADMPRVDELVALVLSSEGETGISQRLANGTLQKAVTSLSPQALEIARETRSLETALGWSAVAGLDLPKVIDLGLYRRASLDGFTHVSLGRILAIEDRLAAVRVASISRTARDSLFELNNRDLTTLARGLTQAELETLASYLTGLERPAKERVLKTVAASPARMQMLAPGRVRDAVIASRDQLAAVTMMLRADTGLDPATVREDVMLVYDGRVSPLLLWDRHPIAVATMGVLALILLLMLRRVMFGGRSSRGKPGRGAQAA